MVFQENRLLADDSPEISYLIFFQKLGKMSQNLSSAAVLIGALRVKWGTFWGVSQHIEANCSDNLLPLHLTLFPFNGNSIV